MTHVPHDLFAEFPDDAAVLHALKEKDAHFNQRAETYRTLNHEIHRIEAEIEPTSDEHLEALKRQRLALLDEVAAMIAAAKAGVAS